MGRPLRVQVVSPSELPRERRRRGGGRRGREGGIGRVNTFSDGSAWDALFVFKSYLLESNQVIRQSTAPLEHHRVRALKTCLI